MTAELMAEVSSCRGQQRAYRNFKDGRRIYGSAVSSLTQAPVRLPAQTRIRFAACGTEPAVTAAPKGHIESLYQCTRTEVPWHQAQQALLPNPRM